MAVWQTGVCKMEKGKVEKGFVVMDFCGRQDELRELAKIRERSRNRAQFTVVTGRRRVGKTELIEKAFNDGETPYLYFLVTQRSEKDLCTILQEEANKVVSPPILGTVEHNSVSGVAA